MAADKTPARYVEELFEKYGAKPADDLNETVREKFGMRQVYRLGKEFYRVQEADVEGKDYLIISTTDIEKYAAMTIMDDIAIFPADETSENMEREVMAALGAGE